jgi:transducin (beta)-like 1
MTVTLDTVNRLVWHYLESNGFEHSAFLFRTEALLSPDDAPSDLTLVTVLQQALLHIKLEQRILRATADRASPLGARLASLEAEFGEPDAAPPPPRPTVAVAIRPENALILPFHRGDVFCCKWSHDGAKLATASADGTAVICTIGSGAALDRKILGVIQHPPDSHGITTIDWHRDSRFFATGSFDTTARVYTGTGALVATLSGHSMDLYCVRFSPLGGLIATCSADGSVMVWVADTGKHLKTLSGHQAAVLDADWKDDKTIATASADCTIGLFAIDGTFQFLKGHTDRVVTIAWGWGKATLASASDDQTVRVWRPGREHTVLRGHNSRVRCVKWVGKSDSQLVSAAANGSVCVWDAAVGACLRMVHRQTKEILALAVAPSGVFFGYGGSEQAVDVVETASGAVLMSFEGTSQVFDLQWDPSGCQIAVAFGDATAVVIPAYQLLKSLK